jgi:hypothetical protein
MTDQWLYTDDLEKIIALVQVIKGHLDPGAQMTKKPERHGREP